MSLIAEETRCSFHGCGLPALKDTRTIAPTPQWTASAASSLRRDAPLPFAYPQFLSISYDRFATRRDGLVVRDEWQTSYAAFFDAGQIVSYILTGGSCATR
jgi:hypothetical protein